MKRIMKYIKTYLDTVISKVGYKRTGHKRNDLIMKELEIHELKDKITK